VTNSVSDPQQPAVQPDAQRAPEFDVYTPSFPPQQQAPMAPMAPVAPPKPKKTGIVVLSLFVVLLFGAAGAFGVLFFQEKGHSTELSKQVETKDREIADLTKQAKNSKDDAAKAEAATKKAEAEVALAQKCRSASKALMEAAIAQDDAKGEAAMKDIFTTC
jgi:hypothetical protein